MTDPNFQLKILDYCRQERLFSEGSRVVLGVSGGADSVCLCHLLYVLRQEWNLTLFVVHVNHGLRENAVRDEAFTVSLCERLGIPCEVFYCDVKCIAKERGESLEEAGRNERYRIFEEVRVRRGADVIALAHHMDDQAETILWNLLRGTGLSGLRGMLPKRGAIVRPLLCVTHSEIEAYLTAQGIGWQTDETNLDNTYTRNKIRNCLLPELEADYNSRVREHLVQTGKVAASVEDYLAKQTDAAWTECVTVFTGRDVPVGQTVLPGHADEDPACRRWFLNETQWRLLEPAIGERILMRLLFETAGNGQDFGAVHVRLVRELFSRPAGKRIMPGHGVIVQRTGQGLVFSRPAESGASRNAGQKEGTEPFGNAGEDIHPDLRAGLERDGSITSGPYTLTLAELSENDDPGKYQEERQYTKWFDYDIIRDNLSVRTRCAGDRLAIDDAGHTQKLKQYFINEKIPAGLRDRLPLLTDGTRILWIPGYRMNADYKVRQGTRRVLRADYSPAAPEGDKE